ncbi:MAG TPA: class II aldolase/adducin family protein [Thermoanaerobaculia bacterium]|nr:class II aldolase/adducin family protein [Thermoanaerobaculia bacterium]
MLDERQARAALTRVARRLHAKGILTATDGNLSARLSGNRILITPSGCCKGTVEEADLVVVEGDDVRGSGRPSSEIALHRAVYEARADIACVIHAHPPHATAFAVAGIALDRPILSESILAIGPVPLAPYALPTRPDLARSIEPFVRDHEAVLLEHHGAAVWAATVEGAGLLMETLEHVARIDWLSRALGSRELPSSEVDSLVALRAALRRGP